MEKMLGFLPPRGCVYQLKNKTKPKQISFYITKHLCTQLGFQMGIDYIILYYQEEESSTDEVLSCNM